MQHSRANRAQGLILVAIIIIGVAVVLIAFSVFSNRSRPSPVVVEAYWQIDDQRVSTASLGAEVHAHVIVRAAGEYYGSIEVKVRKDISLWSDSDYQTSTIPVNLAAGNEEDLTVAFTPDQASGGRLRGYFLEVKFRVTGASWAMENSYPPRLKVTD